MERKIPFKKLLLAFILATVIYIGIFFIAFSVSYYNYQKTSQQNEELLNAISEIDTLVNNFEKCEDETLLKSSQILDNVGARLSLLETRLGKNDQQVLEQKKLYTFIEIKHFQLVKKSNQICGKNQTIILFFYSNEEELEKESERFGTIISAYKEENPSTMVYSFDFNLETNLIKELKDTYNIMSAPIIVLNEKKQIYVYNIDDLVKEMSRTIH